MKKDIGYVLLLLTLVLACTGERKQSQDASLDEYFQNEFPTAEPGGAILVMKNDSLVFSKGYGVSDIKTKQMITPQTLFNLGSISKTFVSNAILMLRDEGKLSLEDSLSKYFPSFKNKAIAQKVKIKHLLTHTSGLPDNRNVAQDTVFYLTAKDAENWYPVTQTDTVNFQPGEKYEYSNPAFNALALIVEQVSGMKWQTFVKDRIMTPSGMTSSTITDGPHPTEGVSHGYVMNHGEWVEDDYGEEPTFPAAGNGGVWSSVEELAKYEQALRNATFVSNKTLAESRTIKTFDNWKSDSPPAIGWSWFIGTSPDGLQTIGHTGSQGGFLCNYVTIPEKQILFVILCNAPRNVDGYTQKIFQWLKENNYFE